MCHGLGRPGGCRAWATPAAGMLRCRSDALSHSREGTPASWKASPARPKSQSCLTRDSRTPNVRKEWPKIVKELQRPFTHVWGPDSLYSATGLPWIHWDPAVKCRQSKQDRRVGRSGRSARHNPATPRLSQSRRAKEAVTCQSGLLEVFLFLLF